MRTETPRGRPAGSRVAVLGGTGWLGRHVCAAFSRGGYGVVSVARGRVADIPADTFVGLDLACAAPETIAQLLRSERVSVVVNATDAANATDGWAKSEEAMAAGNVGLVRRLLAAMSSLPWQCRIVHIGTIHEYGVVSTGTAIDEAVRPQPRTPYTRTKLAGSQAVLDAARAGDVDGLVLRSANISGPFPSPESFPGKLVQLLREAVAQRRRMTVNITDARRDFIDVRDVAEAVVKAAEAAATGEAVNIGSGVAVDMRTLVRLFVTGAGYPLDMIEEVRRDVASFGGSWTLADIGLAARLLDWRPRIGLAESLRDMWDVATAQDRSVA